MDNTMFSWKAVYKNGTSLSQFKTEKDSNNKLVTIENSYADIDRAKLSQFILMDSIFDKPVVIIYFDRPTQRLICRKRMIKQMDQKARLGVWIVGWQELRQGVNIQMISFVYPDGHIEIMDRFREDDRIHYGFKFRQEEEV